MYDDDILQKYIDRLDGSSTPNSSCVHPHFLPRCDRSPQHSDCHQISLTAVLIIMKVQLNARHVRISSKMANRSDLAAFTYYHVGLQLTVNRKGLQTITILADLKALDRCINEWWLRSWPCTLYSH